MGFNVSRLKSHYETVYFLPLRLRGFWYSFHQPHKDEDWVFESRTPGLWIQHLKHQAIAPPVFPPEMTISNSNQKLRKPRYQSSVISFNFAWFSTFHHIFLLKLKNIYRTWHVGQLNVYLFSWGIDRSKLNFYQHYTNARTNPIILYIMKSWLILITVVEI